MSKVEKEMIFIDRLLNATQTMKMLNISRAHFYTRVINDQGFKDVVHPVSLVSNGKKQYRESELVKFIEAKQVAA